MTTANTNTVSAIDLLLVVESTGMAESTVRMVADNDPSGFAAMVKKARADELAKAIESEKAAEQAAKDAEKKHRAALKRQVKFDEDLKVRAETEVEFGLHMGDYTNRLGVKSCQAYLISRYQSASIKDVRPERITPTIARFFIAQCPDMPADLLSILVSVADGHAGQGKLLVKTDGFAEKEIGNQASDLKLS